MFLLFSGPPSSGKTSSVGLFNQYLQGRGYVVINQSPWPGTKCVLSNGVRTVLLWDETDQVQSIKGLLGYSQKFPKVDVIVTTPRDQGDPMRTRLFTLMGINLINTPYEIPLGRMKRGASQVTISWYLNAIHGVVRIIASNYPYNL